MWNDADGSAQIDEVVGIAGSVFDVDEVGPGRGVQMWPKTRRGKKGDAAAGREKCANFGT